MMASFTDVVLALLLITNAVHAFYLGKCSNKQFKCSTGYCVDKNMVCDGLYDCQHSCISAGESSDFCKDQSDEEHCDYTAVLPKDKRIDCLKQDAAITDSTICSHFDCVWDASSSTCFKKWSKASGGLKCNYCVKRSGVFKCYEDKGKETCDIYLSEFKNKDGMGDINDQRCMRVNNQRTTYCSTAQYCEDNKASVSCCEGDYCNHGESMIIKGDNDPDHDDMEEDSEDVDESSGEEYELFYPYDGDEYPENNCTADQFECKERCIDLSLTCNGINDCYKACKSAGGSPDECKGDTSDEDNCDYSMSIPQDKRINCGDIIISDEQTCHNWNCVWDPPTSTCFRKWARASGGLKCKFCIKQDSGLWKCWDDEQYTICDQHLVGPHWYETGVTDIHDQRCKITDGKASCATAKYCEDNKASARCCDSDYCNVPPLPTEFHCEANQFTCNRGCIDKSLVCNGYNDCWRECKDFGGDVDECKDYSDEANCDYSMSIPQDKRINCGDVIISDEQTCHNWNCVWDHYTSTCFRRWARASGGLKCKFCIKQDSNNWKCWDDKKYTICDQYLVGSDWYHTGVTDVHNQRCMIEDGKASCATAKYCEDNKESAICCDSDYCNVPPLPTDFHCEANQFTCNRGCIDKSLACNGHNDCWRECKALGGDVDDCKDYSDEANCDYPMLIPQDKRINCEKWGSMISDEQTCQNFNCAWDPPTSTCFRRWARASGGLKCKFCIKQDSGLWECSDVKKYTICDQYLVGPHWYETGVTDVHNQRCMIELEGSSATCATAKYCEDNQASASCCTGDCCNVPPLLTNFNCEANQFKCKYGCIDKSLTCNGYYDCEKECKTLGGGRDECKDHSDEDNCEYSATVDKDKRILCYKRNSPIKNSETCEEYHCVWDATSSTCYQKFPRASGGLKCNYCEIDPYSSEGIYVCNERGHHKESCNDYLPLYRHHDDMSDVNDQRCIIESGKASCSTAKYCEKHKDRATCCDSDYCNEVKETVNVDRGEKPVVGKADEQLKKADTIPDDDVTTDATTTDATTESTPEETTEEEDEEGGGGFKNAPAGQGAIIKSDIIACVIALTLAMIAA